MSPGSGRWRVTPANPPTWRPWPSAMATACSGWIWTAATKPRWPHWRNSYAPILLLKHLLPLLRGRHPCTVAALSARVGSIGDNRLGGWYSYRASKAALNQLLHTASIELSRLNPNSCVLRLHPGTTNTALSKPFQANVPAEQLFTPNYSAECLLAQIEQHGPAHTGSFWGWDGQPIPW